MYTFRNIFCNILADQMGKMKMSGLTQTQNRSPVKKEAYDLFG